MSSEVGSRIAKNSTFNVLRTLIAVPILLLITPYIVRHLGKEEFGVWALVNVVSSYAQLSDFGITESLIKFVAEFKAKGETLRLNQLLNTALTAYFFLAIIFFSLFVTFLPFIVERVLSIPPALSEKALYVFTVAILLFVINLMMGVFGSLILGFQRMGYSNAISLCSTLLLAVGTVVFLHQGYGLKGLIYNNAIVSAFVICSNALVARRLFPAMRLNPFRYCTRETLAQIFSFSWKVQVSNMTQLLIFQLDRVLLSHYVGLTAVGYYEVANRIASQVRGVVASMFSPMVPAASALQAGDESERVSGLYRRSFKYMAMVDIPLALLVVALAHPFVMAWMGSGYETSAVTMQLLMGSYMLNLLTGPGAFILSGINKPEIGMRSSVIAGMTNLVLCLYLVQSVGYYGVIIAVFISLMTSSVYFVWMLHKNIPGLSWRLYPRTMFRPMLLAGLLGGGLLTIPANYLASFPLLCLVGAIYLALVFLGFFLGEYLDEFDKGLLMKFFPGKGLRA